MDKYNDQDQDGYDPPLDRTHLLALTIDGENYYVLPAIEDVVIMIVMVG
jgi:hypothetical protein